MSYLFSRFMALFTLTWKAMMHPAFNRSSSTVLQEEKIMTSRVNHFKTVPAPAKSLGDLSMALRKTSLDATLKHLVDIRASQLNHCAFCLDCT